MQGYQFNITNWKGAVGLELIQKDEPFSSIFDIEYVLLSPMCITNISMKLQKVYETILFFSVFFFLLFFLMQNLSKYEITQMELKNIVYHVRIPNRGEGYSHCSSNEMLI